MKYTEFKLDGHTIAIENSVFGKETIKLDGQRVSQKYSLYGTTHDFAIGQETFQLELSYKPFRDGILQLTLFKGDKSVVSDSIQVHPRHRLAWMAMGLALVYMLIKLVH